MHTKIIAMINANRIHYSYKNFTNFKARFGGCDRWGEVKEVKNNTL